MAQQPVEGPHFVLAPHDKLTPIVLRTYIEWYSVQPNSDATLIKELLAHLEAIMQWQREHQNEVVLADTSWLIG